MRKTGDKWERAAASYLAERGLELLEQNFQTRLGEIDLILRDQDYLVFCEVRYRKAHGYGSGADTITWHKQKKIVNAARQYLAVHKAVASQPCRFDVVSVSDMGEQPQFDWIKNAFESHGW